MIISPGDQKTQSVAQVRYQENYNRIVVKFQEKNEDFRNLIKTELGYTWEGLVWEKKINSRSGNVNDRISETGAKILVSGFIVDFPDDKTAENALNGNYEPECTRWAYSGTGKYENYIIFEWSKNDDLYKFAISLHGAKYAGDIKRVFIDPCNYDEIIGFCEKFNFKISNDARRLIDSSIKKKLSYKTSKPKLIPSIPIIETKRDYLQIPDNVSIVENLIDDKIFDFNTTTDLMPHQESAMKKIETLKVGGLFMDAGTGKTRTAIQLVHKRRFRISNVVWFCPVSLKETIKKEIELHTDSEDLVYTFDDDTSDITIPIDKLWYIVGIESMSSSDRVVYAVNKIVNDHSFVIVDESDLIKTHDAIRTERITDISKKSLYRLILTGTPISNGVQDLYSQFRFLSPEILGYNSFYSFSSNHLEYSDKYPGLVVSAHNEKWLAAKVSPYIYQVTKSECLDLPEKLYDTRYYSMTFEQRNFYNEIKSKILDESDRYDSYAIFKLFSSLQQIVSGFYKYDDGNIVYLNHHRTNQLISIVNAIKEEKVIIWCKYIHSLTEIKNMLESEFDKTMVCVHYGELSESERSLEIERFRKSGRFLISTMATGGRGLTLNEANHVIFYENSFKYSDREQSENRCHRIGQNFPVTYFDIVCNKSIDEHIQKSLKNKVNVVQNLKHQIDRMKNDYDQIKMVIDEIC